MRIPIGPAGEVGINLDLPAHELPPEAWSNGKNVKFRQGRVEKAKGYATLFGSPTVAPYWLLPVATTTNVYWVYAGLTKVYVTDMIGGHFNITRIASDYTANATNLWNGGILGKIPILNNGVDAPQQWNPVGTGTKLVDLANWPASTKASIVRPFKNFLVALDVTEASTRYPQLVRWSHPADPGAVPTSWDYTDTTKDAGRIELSETGDFCIDCMPMRDFNIIYKEKTAWAMQFVGGEFVFKFVQILREGGAGILSRNCMVSLPGYQHFVVTFNDVIVHDGTRMESVIDARMRTALFNAIDGTNSGRVFVVANYARDEILVCIPQSGDSEPTLAFVWNYKDGQWSKYELPGISYAVAGVVDTGSSGIIDSDSGIIDLDTSIIDEREYNPTISKVVMAQPAATLIREYGTTEQFAGSNMTAYVERTGLAVSGLKNGDPVVDPTVSKLVSAVWPRMRGTGPVNVYVGGQETVNGTVTWEGPYAFNPNTDRKVDCRTSAKLLGVKFESTTNISWEIDGYELDLVVDGER